MSGVRILGLGISVPEGRITNADLEARMDTTDAWITERTGIAERRIAGPGETTASLATEAGAAAIKDAGLTPGDIDLLIVATTTPEQLLPATAAFVQDALGVQGGAFDLAAACSGFVYSLVMAAGLIAIGGARHALIVGAETLTRIVDPDDRGTAILFGDGAGAAVVGPASDVEGSGLLAWDLGCDGSATSILQVRGGGSRLPLTPQGIADKLNYAEMDGREVFRRAVRAVIDTAAITLDKAGVTAADVDVFVPHQANARIVSAACDRLGIPADKTVVNLDRYGNTSAASIPIALAEAVEGGRIVDGDLVLLAGFGAGMTWASALVRWGG